MWPLLTDHVFQMVTPPLREDMVENSYYSPSSANRNYFFLSPRFPALEAALSSKRNIRARSFVCLLFYASNILTISSAEGPGNQATQDMLQLWGPQSTILCYSGSKTELQKLDLDLYYHKQIPGPAPFSLLIRDTGISAPKRIRTANLT